MPAGCIPTARRASRVADSCATQKSRHHGAFFLRVGVLKYTVMRTVKKSKTKCDTRHLALALGHQCFLTFAVLAN